MIDLKYLFCDRPAPGTARQIAFTFPSGGETLIGNYAEPTDGAILRPWEGIARIWR